MKSFIIFIHRILLGWSTQGVWGERHT